MDAVQGRGCCGWRVAVVVLAAASFQPVDGGTPKGAPTPPTGGPPAPACPVDAYQDAPIVFGCAGSGVGEVKTRVILEHFRESLEFGVPSGITDLTVTMDASNFDGDIAIYDPVAGVWVKDRLKQCSEGVCSGNYKGMHIESTYSSGQPTHEKAKFTGLIPTVLRIKVQSYAMQGAEFTLGYSYGAAPGDCVPTAVAGCTKYDAVAARQAATQWSRWARYHHATVDDAWTSLAAPYADIDRVPWHRWCNVWAQWSAGTKQSADCKAVFKYITAGGMEKGIDYVDRQSFTFAYNLQLTTGFNAQCCSKVRMGYPDEASAWSALTASGSDITSTIYSVCEQLAEGDAALNREWLRVVEENGVPGMQAQEFHSCWTTGLECPRYNYYRTQGLLFGCQPEIGRTSILLPKGPGVVGEIPAGIADLNLSVQVTGHDAEIALKDAQSNEYAVKAKGGACNGEKKNCKFHGADLGWSSHQPAQWVAFKDPTPTPLTLEVDAGVSAVTTAEVTYSYAGYKQCPNQPDSDAPDVPAGCTYLDVTQPPPQACIDFSKFLEYMHTDITGLMRYLDESSNVQMTSVGKGVPFHLWPSVWADWPQNAKHGQVWQECFHWCDGNHDGLVDEPELEICLLLSRTHDMTDKFCAGLCHTYPNENALWATWANGAETILAGRWESLWDSEAETATKGVSPAQSFRYTDKDGNGAISNAEFASCYGVGNCGHSWPLLGNLLNGGAAAGRYGQRLANHKAKVVAMQVKPAANTTNLGSFTSSENIPVWILWALVGVTCLGLVCAVAAVSFSPFFFRGKKRSTVSSIGEESQADLEHDRAYNNLSLIDTPDGTGLPVLNFPSGSGFPTREPSGQMTPPPALNFAAQRLAGISTMPSLSSMTVPMQMSPLTTAVVQRGGQAPVTTTFVQMQPGGQAPLTTFVPYPQRGMPGARY